MKRFFQHLVFTLFLLVAGMAYAQAQTVYITENGKKYHAKNCNLVKTGKKGIELAEAKKQGLEPCKACKSDAISKEEKKQVPAKGKK